MEGVRCPTRNPHAAADGRHSLLALSLHSSRGEYPSAEGVDEAHDGERRMEGVVFVGCTQADRCGRPELPIRGFGSSGPPLTDSSLYKYVYLSSLYRWLSLLSNHRHIPQ